MASYIRRSVSSLVSPVATQPGRSGEYAEEVPAGVLDHDEEAMHHDSLSPACFSMLLSERAVFIK